MADEHLDCWLIWQDTTYSMIWMADWTQWVFFFCLSTLNQSFEINACGDSADKNMKRVSQKWYQSHVVALLLLLFPGGLPHVLATWGTGSVNLSENKRDTMWVGSASVGPWRGNRPPTSYLHIQTGCRMHHVPQTDKWNLIISILELLLLFVFLVFFLSFLFMLCICIRYYSRAQCPRKFRIKLGLGWYDIIYGGYDRDFANLVYIAVCK